MSKVLEYTRKGIWLLGVNNKKLIDLNKLQGLGVTSCLARNDFNVAFSIITLMLLINFYNSKTKAITKIIIQMIALLILADIIWIILFSTAWEHDTQSENPSEDVQFWDSLWFIHKLVYVLAYIELLLKGFLLYYLVVYFKEKYQLKDLFNLNYDDEKSKNQDQNFNEQPNMGENSFNNYQNESNNSYVDNFQNKY